MRKTQFLRLPEFEDEDDMTVLNIGDHFLYGSTVREQKQEKKNGDTISYYQVINKTRNGVEYVAIVDAMEGDEEL